MSSVWLGIDVGGANCKFATTTQDAWSVPFSLWLQPQKLHELLATEVQRLQQRLQLDGIALTMTGELADCFRTKREGVQQIVESARDLGGLPLWVYLTDGSFVSGTEAIDRPLQAAASNWHGLTQFVAWQEPSRQGLLVDIGTTTTDLIPFGSGKVLSRGKSDPQRLASGELVYVGVERTPIATLLDNAWYQGQRCPLAREWFATTLDAYVWSCDIEERPTDNATCDGRPVTREFAFERLARMVCADRDLFTADDADRMADATRKAHVSLIVQAIKQIRSRASQPMDDVVWSGQSDFLVDDVRRLALPDATCKVLSDQIGEAASRCAPAYAIARLAQHQSDANGLGHSS